MNVSVVTFEICYFWNLLLLKFVTFEICYFWKLLLLRFCLNGEGASIYQMIHQFHFDIITWRDWRISIHIIDYDKIFLEYFLKFKNKQESFISAKTHAYDLVKEKTHLNIYSFFRKLIFCFNTSTWSLLNYGRSNEKFLSKNQRIFLRFFPAHNKRYGDHCLQEAN